MTLRVTLLLVLALASGAALAKTERSAAAVLAFKRHTICPSTGTFSRKCPGHVVDHIDPLCNGGRDHPSNMQYQTIADAKAKDRWERRLCRSLKRQ